MTPERGGDYKAVIVVCHGTLMQYVLGMEHPQNGQVQEFAYEVFGYVGNSKKDLQ
ncbi:MAG: hypothetical protein ACI39R_00435 [Lachnospiraceae bacterium]